MKKAISLALCLCLCLSFGCGVSNGETGGKIKVVAEIFPEYDWVKSITKGSDNVTVSLLMKNGADMHSYQPSVADILEITDSDLFIYTGGESDEWIEDALKNNADLKGEKTALLSVLGDMAKEEESVSEIEEKENDVNLDEHIWLSLKNACVCCRFIAEKLCKLDPQNASLYQSNLDEYLKELSALDERYETELSAFSQKALVVADRFPFRYLFDDYGISYCAAFDGCSAETEASFKTISFLAEKVDGLSLSSILTTESSDGKIAAAVRENTRLKNQDIMPLDSLQSVNADKTDNISYLGVMENNLEVLIKALSK